jgi:predicted HD superfamily hydrolase involved in NAD metabolism
MSFDEILLKIESTLSNKRFLHSIGVMASAKELAKMYGINKDKAALAGLLHDCARDIKAEDIFILCKRFHIKTDYVTRAQPELLHGPIGSKIAEKEYGVTNKEVLEAIYYHTTGCEHMTPLTKIVFIADYIEPGRSFHGVEEVRKLANIDLDGAVLLALNNTLEYVISKGAMVHTDTIFARNHLIFERGI